MATPADSLRISHDGERLTERVLSYGVRIVLRMIVIVCLVLCVATASAWVWFHCSDRGWEWGSWRWEGADFVRQGKSLRLIDGSLETRSLWQRFPPPVAAQAAKLFEKEATGFHWVRDVAPLLSGYAPDVNIAGLQIARKPAWGWTAVAIPLWMPTLLFAVPPLLVLFRRRWWVIIERSRQGLCPTCGYDLRATTGRCPECGLEPRPVAALVPGWFRISWAAARAKVTACFWWMAFYLGAAVLCEILVASSVREWETFVTVGSAAILPVLFGAFHAAKFSRSGEAFFCYGCLGGLLLLPPLLVLIDRLGMLTTGRMVALSLVLCLASILAVGFLARSAAALRWRRLGRQIVPGQSGPTGSCGKSTGVAL